MLSGFLILANIIGQIGSCFSFKYMEYTCDNALRKCASRMPFKCPLNHKYISWFVISLCIFFLSIKTFWQFCVVISYFLTVGEPHSEKWLPSQIILAYSAFCSHVLFNCSIRAPKGVIWPGCCQATLGRVLYFAELMNLMPLSPGNTPQHTQG